MFDSVLFTNSVLAIDTGVVAAASCSNESSFGIMVVSVPWAPPPVLSTCSKVE